MAVFSIWESRFPPEHAGTPAALEAHVPGLVSTEPVSVPIGMSVLDLARSAALTTAQLLDLGDALTKLVPVTA